MYGTSALHSHLIISTITNNNSMSESNEVRAMNIATISAGFEKGDFLVREEQGNRVYFDFFEEVCSQNSFVL